MSAEDTTPGYAPRVGPMRTRLAGWVYNKQITRLGRWTYPPPPPANPTRYQPLPSRHILLPTLTRPFPSPPPSTTFNDSPAAYSYPFHPANPTGFWLFYAPFTIYSR